ncbi:MAG: lipocalin-like domain-containing protein [Nanoarchaeota archaeon]
MKKRVKLPEDENPHKNQAIEWWYFNGFLEGKNKYAYMTCFFKANRKKLNLRFLELPTKDVYFSHSLLYNLTTKRIIKDVLPIVIPSKDIFSRKQLFINYFFPLRTNFINYEILRQKDGLRVKNKFLDLNMKSMKKPLLEGGTGFLDLGQKTTYYYTYSNLKTEGFIGSEFVKGKSWHDKQWSTKGFMKDYWLWFSLQMPNNTEIVCFDYKGKKLATISYPNNKQKTVVPEFFPIGKPWKSKKSGNEYVLEWKIKIGEFEIKTKPIIKDCEVNFGTINYWEGPITIHVNGIKSHGFMESLTKQKEFSFRESAEKEIKEILKNFNFKKLMELAG